MSSPRTFLTPPFDDGTSGFAPISPKLAAAWDGITYPPPADVLGPWSLAFTAEKWFQWQCRMGYWDYEFRWYDFYGFAPDIIHNYGDTTPVDSFPTWLSRELQVYTTTTGEQVPVGGSGFVGFLNNIDLHALADTPFTAYYPSIGISNGSTAIQDNTGTLFYPLINFQPQAATWVSMTGVGIDDQAGGLWMLPLWHQPYTDLTPNPLQLEYVLDYWNIKPTVFISS